MVDARDVSVDVLVVGSGNGALTAALCAYEMGAKDGDDGTATRMAPARSQGKAAQAEAIKSSRVSVELRNP